MIENEKQRAVTAYQLSKFKDALSALPTEPTADLHPLLLKAMREDFEIEIEALEAQIHEYDNREAE